MFIIWLHIWAFNCYTDCAMLGGIEFYFNNKLILSHFIENIVLEDEGDGRKSSQSMWVGKGKNRQTIRNKTKTNIQVVTLLPLKFKSSFHWLCKNGPRPFKYFSFTAGTKFPFVLCKELTLMEERFFFSSSGVLWLSSCSSWVAVSNAYEGCPVVPSTVNAFPLYSGQ